MCNIFNWNWALARFVTRPRRSSLWLLCSFRAPISRAGEKRSELFALTESAIIFPRRLLLCDIHHRPPSLVPR